MWEEGEVPAPPHHPSLLTFGPFSSLSFPSCFSLLFWFIFPLSFSFLLQLYKNVLPFFRAFLVHFSYLSFHSVFFITSVFQIFLSSVFSLHISVPCSLIISCDFCCIFSFVAFFLFFSLLFFKAFILPKLSFLLLFVVRSS